MGPTRDRTQVFTTGEVARLLKFSQRKINACFDRGELVGRRIPGSTHRRVLRPAVVKFIVRFALPIPPGWEGEVRAALDAAEKQT